MPPRVGPLKREEEKRMFCPNCKSNIADDSIFCGRCGTPLNNQRAHRTQNGAVPPPRGKPWNKVFWVDMYKDNKPGFFIIAAMVLALFVTFGYFLYSRTTGGLVVTIEKISKEEELNLNVKNVLKVYCREFAKECTERGMDQIEKDIRHALPRILIPVKTLDAKITYKNSTRYPIQVNRFLYRTAPGPWRGEVGDTQNRYAPKLQRLRFVIETTNGNVPFETKLDYAGTLALVENAGSFMIQPGEEKFWRIGYTEGTEVQIEYLQNGKLYRTSVLRPR